MPEPIDQPGFNIHRKREPNPERIERIRELGMEWRELLALAEAVRQRIVPEVQEATETGHSLRQLAEALDVSMGTIQRMLKDG